VWEAGFGVKDAARREPVDAETVFEAASLSKSVFAYGVLALCHAGLLDLDTPLTHYLPDRSLCRDPRLEAITARTVLSHTTGFPNWRQRGKPLTIDRVPGESFGYSGDGYLYLQRVVE
jgi:CubicO group peptidase (beta-lactamase class C family)